MLYTRAQIVNEATLINNDYNAIYARLIRVAERNPNDICRAPAETLKTRLKAQWDKFNKHIDSKNEFNYPKMLEYRAELQTRMERAKAWCIKHTPPAPPREITDINDKVYKNAKKNTR